MCCGSFSGHGVGTGCSWSEKQCMNINILMSSSSMIMLQFTRQNTGDIIDSFQTSAVFSAQEPKRISLSLRPKTENKKDYCFTKVNMFVFVVNLKYIFHIRVVLKLQLTFLTSSTQMWILAMTSTSMRVVGG